MGIQGLTKIIGDHAPTAIRETTIKAYQGRKVAVDASMFLYQFLIAIRTDAAQLMDADGNTTSHIAGTFYRTIRMMEHGILPVYVFDGTPPELKAVELQKRASKRNAAAGALNGGDIDKVQHDKRVVKVTREHVNDVKSLLTLMGVPWLDAPTEAESTCAALCKAGLVYGVASEDLDTLTFGAPILLRNLTASEARKLPVMEIRLPQVLEGLGLTYDAFVDMCILLGCDYCETIKGVGRVRAVNLIKQHGSIDDILQVLDPVKNTLPDPFPYLEIRELFKSPDVVDVSKVKLQWKMPDKEALIAYLVDKSFNVERVTSAVERLIKYRSSGRQTHLDSFFKK